MLERLACLMILFILLVGCRQGGGDAHRLVELDSLIAAAPDSAAALLAAVPADSLPTAGDRAYHALLLTQARYKAYIPLDSTSLDTINLAVAHYADGDDGDKLTRSLLYKGCVMEELGRPDSAMYYYKAAEDHATQSGDTYHRGYALMRMAWLFHSQYDFKRAIALNMLSLEAFESCNAKRQELQVLYTTASLYTTINTDSALLLANLAMDISSSLGYDRDYCCRTLADVYFLKKEYSRTIEMARKSIASTADRDVYFHCHQLIARSFAILGHPDSSEYYLQECTPPQNSKDTLALMTTLSAIAVATGSPHANEFQMSSINLADTIVNKASIKCLEKALFNYESDVLASRHSSKTSKLILMSLSLLFAVVAMLVSTVYIRRKKKRVDIKNRQLSSELARKNTEITVQRHTTSQLSSQFQELHSAYEMLSQQMDEKQRLLQKTDAELNRLKEEVAQLQSSGKIEQLDACTKRSVETLAHEIRKQSVASAMKIMSANKSSLQVRKLMHAHFDENYRTTLQLLVDVLYPKLKENISRADPPLDEDELVVTCMHFLDFPGKIIGAYLGYTSRFSVSHKKSLIAAKVLGENAKINQLAQ